MHVPSLTPSLTLSLGKGGRQYSHINTSNKHVTLVKQESRQCERESESRRKKSRVERDGQTRVGRYPYPDRLTHKRKWNRVEKSSLREEGKCGQKGSTLIHHRSLSLCLTFSQSVSLSLAGACFDFSLLPVSVRLSCLCARCARERRAQERVIERASDENNRQKWRCCGSAMQCSARGKTQDSESALHEAGIASPSSSSCGDRKEKPERETASNRRGRSRRGMEQG